MGLIGGGLKRTNRVHRGLKIRREDRSVVPSGGKNGRMKRFAGKKGRGRTKINGKKSVDNKQNLGPN